MKLLFEKSRDICLSPTPLNWVEGNKVCNLDYFLQVKGKKKSAWFFSPFASNTHLFDHLGALEQNYSLKVCYLHVYADLTHVIIFFTVVNRPLQRHSDFHHWQLCCVQSQQFQGKQFLECWESWPFYCTMDCQERTFLTEISLRL